MRRRGFLLILGLFMYSGLFAQQSSIYSQYMFNGLAINPAYAGQDNLLSITALARLQSVGLEGAPDTQTLSVHTPVVKDKMGLGLQFFHEKIGVTDQTGVFASYSYRIQISDFKLSFGLQAGVNFYNTQYSQLVVQNPGDPVFQNDERSVTPNFGSGVLLTNKMLFVGVSMPQMLSTGDKDKTIIQETPFMVYGGYTFELNPVLKLTPSTLFKLVNGRPVEWNINANLIIKDLVWVGVSFRPVNAVVGMLQLQLTDQLSFGYGYDITLGELRTIESGSHEFMLNYRFRFSQKDVISPRYF